MKSTFTKSLVATAVLMLSAGAAFAATTGTPVTISDNLGPHTVTQLNGQYDETVNFNTSATVPNSFTSTAYFGAGAWYNGTTPTKTGLNSNYGIYATFTAAGTYSANTTTGAITFNPTSATVQLYKDVNFDTTEVTNATTGAMAYTGLTDDLLLGSTSALMLGTGSSNPGTLGNANGGFELLFSSFTLASAGSAYFIAPSPFTLELDLNGNFQSFAVPASNVAVLLNSSANAFFLPPNVVPEPSALALAGIALVGAAVATRRKSRKG